MSEDLDVYGLTIKQRTYAELVATGADEKEAAEQAGFDVAMVTALRTHPLVTKAIADLAKKHVDSLKMTLQEAEIELKAMIAPTPDDFYEQDADGNFVIKQNIPKEKLRAIKEIRVNRDGSQTIVFHNRETLLDKAFKRHGAYVTKHEVKGQIDHKHTHEVDTKSLIEKMNQLLLNKPKQAEVIDVEPEDAPIARRDD